MYILSTCHAAVFIFCYKIHLQFYFGLRFFSWSYTVFYFSHLLAPAIQSCWIEFSKQILIDITEMESCMFVEIKASTEYV